MDSKCMIHALKNDWRERWGHHKGNKIDCNFCSQIQTQISKTCFRLIESVDSDELRLKYFLVVGWF